MSELPDKDAYKEKFRPDADAALDREISAALAGVSLDELYGPEAAPQERGPSTFRFPNRPDTMPGFHTRR